MRKPRFRISTIRDLFAAHRIENLSQLSRECGIADSRLSRLRKGDPVRTRRYRGQPSEAEKLARYFGMPLDRILHLGRKRR